MNSDKKNKGIIAFLLLLILTIGYLSYKNAKDYEKLQNIFLQDKNELESELDKIIANYDAAIDKNITLSVNLEGKRDKLIALKDSIKNLKKDNFSLIKKYRKRILILEAENKKLFSAIDSLNKENNELQEENVTVKGELQEQNEITDKLTKKYEGLKYSNNDLEEKLMKASQIKIRDVKFTALKLKRNEKYIETLKAKKTDAFRLSFTLLENVVAQPGNLDLYVNVVDEDKNCIYSIGNITLSNNKTISYSDVLKINYKNKEETRVSLIKVDRNIIKVGTYTLNVYSDSKLIGSKYISLD